MRQEAEVYSDAKTFVPSISQAIPLFSHFLWLKYLLTIPLKASPTFQFPLFVIYNVCLFLDKGKTMQFETFQQSIKDTAPPPGVSIWLQAMWYDGQGNWDRAHSLVDNLEDTTACWVHAYLL